MPADHDYISRSIELAKNAGEAGNLPIGALITLDGEVIAEGQNRLWFPVTSPARHAEIDALDQVDLSLWPRAKEMTLYTTLEPCLMCLSTILLHHIGRVVYGAEDPHGGAMCTVGHMPFAFERFYKELDITGPALPEECDKLFKQMIFILENRNVKKK